MVKRRVSELTGTSSNIFKIKNQASSLLFKLPYELEHWWKHFWDHIQNKGVAVRNYPEWADTVLCVEVWNPQTE